MAYNNYSGQFQQSYGGQQPYDGQHNSYSGYGGHIQQPYHNTYHKPQSFVSTSRFSEHNDDDYKPLATSTYTEFEMQRLEDKDGKLKSRIRIMKIVSRCLAFILSVATAIPLAMTIVKYLQTRHIVYNVDGEERGAWASGTITIYTYVYFGVSAVAVIMNTIILAAYCRGIRHANKAATVAGVWEGIITAGHIIVWAISVAYYRYGKRKIEGKWKDLWGWACSSSAKEIQPFIPDVDFEKYCKVQDSSFFFGLAQVGAGLLAAAIYLFAMTRIRSKKQLKKAQSRVDDAREPLRQ